MGKSTRTTRTSSGSKARVDYNKINHKYDKFSFVSARHTPKKAFRFTGLVGRASSAPPLTNWPPLGMHTGVNYFADIANDAGWKDGSADTIWLPFNLLDVGTVGWQGLSQTVAGADADLNARAHFDHVNGTLRVANRSTRITEAVGEAAAAIYMLENHAGYTMIWGAHVHAGTGIDQIWKRTNHGGSVDYIIVEAKGPGATLLQSSFVPSGYNQMEFGWVVNHLYSMQQNGHAAGTDIVAKLGLKFAVAHKNFGGASKSYYGLAGDSAHKTKASRVFGVVVTAQWLSNGRLGYSASALQRYL